MTAREKLTDLINAWYAYQLLQALVRVGSHGIGFFSLLFAAIGLAFTIFVTFLVGRWLLARSGFARGLVVVLAAIGLAFGVVGVAMGVWGFLRSRELQEIVQTVLACAGTYVSARTYNTLTDEHVKAYFR